MFKTRRESKAVKEVIGLKKKANWVRNRVFEMCLSGGGHLASSFSCVEILTSLYYGGILKIDPRDPQWEDRDRFILSKGHAAATLYAILADLGFFPFEELDNYCKGLCLLGSHPDKSTPGIESTTGSLGHGLGIAAGIALAAKMDSKGHKTVVLLGDGECSEGAVWEAALFANKRRLDNLVAIVDRNQVCVTDFTEDCIGLEPLVDKWKAFGWQTIEVCGHSLDELVVAFRDFYKNDGNKKPFVIIANTIKGKGLSFMENNPAWHTRIPSGDQIELAKKELIWNENEDS